MGLVNINLGSPGSYQISMTLELDSKNNILKSNIHVIGEPELIESIQKLRLELKGNINDFPTPLGMNLTTMVLRELILKAKNQWVYPYSELELCHCRSVPTEVVDQSIVHGACTPELVSELTSASTSCGSCREDVESIIKYRKGI